MVDAADKERMAQLEARLTALKQANTPPEPSVQKNAVGGAELAWRMVIELVAGIAIGFGIGYGLDVLFGTIPIFLVLFTLFGFAAGVQTMMRSARAAQERETRRAAQGADETERGAFEQYGDDQRGD